VQPASREHDGPEIARAETIDCRRRHGAGRLHRLAAWRRPVHDDEDQAALRRQLVGLDICRKPWRCRDGCRGVGGQRHRREGRKRPRLAVHEHLEVRRHEAGDRPTVPVEHRSGERHDIDAAAKTWQVLLRSHGEGRSHEDESEDSAHDVRMICAPENSLQARRARATCRTDALHCITRRWEPHCATRLDATRQRACGLPNL
jgi:hypothetical protein